MTDWQLLTRGREFCRVLAVSDGLQNAAYLLRFCTIELHVFVATPGLLIALSVYAVFAISWDTGSAPLLLILLSFGTSLLSVYGGFSDRQPQDLVKRAEQAGEYTTWSFPEIHTSDYVRMIHIGMVFLLLTMIMGMMSGDSYTNEQFFTWTLILIAVMIRPFFLIYYLWKFWFNLWTYIRLGPRFTEILFVMVMTLLSLCLVIILSQFEYRKYEDDSERVGVLAFFMLLAFVALCVLLYMFIRNGRKVRKAVRQFDGSRSKVELAFRSLPNARSRLEYVQRLEMRSAAFAHHLASPENRWPSGAPPNFGDVASTKLAQLDGRWWGSD
jgi:hypothetical protein